MVDKRALTPIEGIEYDDAESSIHTAVESPMQGVARRSKETKNAALATLSKVDAVREEVLERVEIVDLKVNAMGEHLSQVRENVGEMRGQLTTLVGVLEEDRAERRNHSMVKFTSMTAEVEVDKAQKISAIEIAKTDRIAEIKDKKAKARLHRELLLKIVAGLAAAWGAIATYLMASC